MARAHSTDNHVIYYDVTTSIAVKIARPVQLYMFVKQSLWGGGRHAWCHALLRCWMSRSPSACACPLLPSEFLREATPPRALLQHGQQSEPPKPPPPPRVARRRSRSPEPLVAGCENVGGWLGGPSSGLLPVGAVWWAVPSRVSDEPPGPKASSSQACCSGVNGGVSSG